MEEANKLGMPLSPIVVLLKLPRQVQSIRKKGEHGRVREDFVIVLDGELLLIAGLCSPGDYVAGFPDVRDRMIELLRHTCQPAIVPPNVMGTHLCVLNGETPKPLRPSSKRCVLQMGHLSSVREAMQTVYATLYRELRRFYDARSIALSDVALARKISGGEYGLLKNLGEFNSTRVWQIWTRHRIGRALRRGIADLLLMLSTHRSHLEELSRERGMIETLLQENSDASDFVEHNFWKTLLSGEVTKADTTLAIIEHAQSEMQTSGIMSVTVWAAVVGAVVASLFVLFQMIARILGVSL
jgi:hypothetical protein